MTVTLGGTARRTCLALLALMSMMHCAGAVAGDDETEAVGDVLRFALPLSAWGLTYVRDDADGRSQFYKSLGVTVASTYALKLSVNKTRPNGESRAFPSGHTSSAFAGAAFMQRRYGWRVGAPAYALAGVVGWSRVATDHHDTTDVLAGAALAMGSAWFFTRPMPHGVSVVPTVESDGLSVRFSVNLR